MSKYKNELSAHQAHVITLRAIIGVMLMIILALFWGWKSAPSKLTIHNPPDLRSGSTRAWWEVDPSNVYAFSFYIFQQLNSWPKNGDADYLSNINALQAYFTPSCHEFLLRDYDFRKSMGELKNRSRNISEIVGRGYSSQFRDPKTNQMMPRTIIVSKDSWNVTFDLAVDEYHSGEAVKRTLVRYPLNVIRSDINPELNPWGLLINCYTSNPQRLVLSTDNGN